MRARRRCLILPREEERLAGGERPALGKRRRVVSPKVQQVEVIAGQELDLVLERGPFRCFRGFE